MALKLSKSILTDKETFNSLTKNKSIFGDKNLTLKFNHNMKSINLSNYNFINFLLVEDKIYIKFLKKEINRIENNTFDILEEYNDKMIGMSPQLKTKIKDIYFQTYGKKINLPYLKRLTKKSNERFQLYYYKVSDNNYLIIIVDLYHLLIPAADKSHNEKKKNPKQTYEKYKLANYDIAKLL